MDILDIEEDLPEIDQKIYEAVARVIVGQKSGKRMAKILEEFKKSHFSHVMTSDILNMSKLAFPIAYHGRTYKTSLSNNIMLHFPKYISKFCNAFLDLNLFPWDDDNLKEIRKEISRKLRRSLI